jgi:hypothetical protein
VNSPPPKPEVILTNFFAEPTVLLVPITSREDTVIFVDVSFDFAQFRLDSKVTHVCTFQ